jgi:hypothetical protein
MSDPRFTSDPDEAPTPILTLRFPDGDVEHRSALGELPVGTRIRARGALWRVTRCAGSTVRLEAYEEDPVNGVPTPTAPAIIPTALSDEPLVVEILSAA